MNTYILCSMPVVLNAVFCYTQSFDSRLLNM
uniref:Uncharacterized protein n=1 Tax=Anguilla anguilla TaxID=7936 RepID=A0A0E9XR09_ANGAN